MTMVELKRKAETIGVQAGKMKKACLIRAIQQAEGYQPCFEFSGGSCMESKCCFIAECIRQR